MSHLPTAYMPLWVGDYLADTMELSAEQHGVYLLLIMHYWKTGGPIKNDPSELRKIAKISSKKCNELLQKFFDLDGDLWRHNRIDYELIRSLEKKEKRQRQTAAATAARMAKQALVTTDVTSNVTLSSLSPCKKERKKVNPQPPLENQPYERPSKFITERNRIARRIEAEIETERSNEAAQLADGRPADAKAIRDERKGTRSDP